MMKWLQSPQYSLCYKATFSISKTVLVLWDGLLICHFSRCLSWSCRFLECSTLQEKTHSLESQLVLWLTVKTAVCLDLLLLDSLLPRSQKHRQKLFWCKEKLFHFCTLENSWLILTGTVNVWWWWTFFSDSGRHNILITMTLKRDNGRNIYFFLMSSTGYSRVTLFAICIQFEYLHPQNAGWHPPESPYFWLLDQEAKKQKLTLWANQTI